MRKIYILLVSLFTLILSAQERDISIQIKNIKSKKGNLIISLFDSQKGFPHRDELKKVYVKPSLDEAICVLKNIPEGVYAVAILHDENANGKMDIGMFGPKERYGFSNNARGFMAPPSFEKASFRHKKRSNVSISLR